MKIFEDMSDFEKDVISTMDALFEKAFKSRNDHLLFKYY